MIVGTALWGYGLLVTGTAPLIDWKSNAPWWIADYLPNMELELGLVLVCLGSLRLTGRANAKGHPHHLGRRWTRPKTVLMRNKATPNTERARDRYSASALASNNKTLARSNTRKRSAAST